MKAAVIIQSRISSTRLPSKALLDLCGKPMTCHVIEHAKAIKGARTVILATGSGEENLPLLKIASECGIESFTGSENDVLERYYLASQNTDCDYIIRVTGDNPLTDHKSASLALEYTYLHDADHCTTSGIPVGTGVEIIKKSALEKAYKNGREPHQREHVTPYIKEHPEIFKILQYRSAVENPHPKLRLTVDTAEDFRLMEILFKALYCDRPILLTEVLSYISKNPGLCEINGSIEQRPMTHHSNG
jgi:spore coat polysaccharide biosynthesis protein SpsF